MAVSSKYSHLVAHLRPGMPRADVDALGQLSEGVLTADRLSGIQPYSGHGKQPCYLKFDSDARISKVTFHYSLGFSSDIEVDGIRSGMTKEEVLSIFPKALQLSRFYEDFSASTTAFEVCTDSSGVRLSAILRDGCVSGVVFDSSAEIEHQDSYYLDWKSKASEREARAAALDEERKLKNQWRNISDPDKMLRAWAPHYSAWGESGKHWEALAEWLITRASTYERHLFLKIYNWDHGYPPILWIMRKADTERATAMVLFHMMDAAYWVKNWEKDLGSMNELKAEKIGYLKELKERLDGNFYAAPKYGILRLRKPIKFVPPKPPRLYDMSNEAVRALYPLNCYDTIKGIEVTLQTHSFSCPVEIN